MFDIVESNGITTLVVRGGVTIQNAASFRDALSKWMAEGNTLALNVEAVDEADLSSLQLICSAHQTAINSKKSLSLAGGVPEVLSRVARDSGFSTAQGCGMDSGVICLWSVRRKA